ncbi:hypothetical protein McpSp1_07790 [Methanocorpusculaceae archaeon Sp1]|uniref:Uncharacterized protein n=1 Tax=Methanorbis furvi TaxID=3028299 RepID=A0AAE4MCY2_9EURY|nr:hypothetical protein [Methanocorpusculaceae archaeon Sp1]MDV0442091.1 hypothetical protein [Methanocorpusculaceae archaeon Ag1]
MTSEPLGGKPEKKLISLRLPLPLLEEIDTFAWKHRTDRSDIIEKSCRHYITAVPCTECGTLNPQSGKKCALCGARLVRPDQWVEKLRTDTDELIFRQRQLCDVETRLESSIFSLEELEEEISAEQKPFLKFHIGDSYLTLKEIQKALILSGTADLSKDIREAEALLEDPDQSLLPDMIGRISHRLAELEYLEGRAEHTIESNAELTRKLTAD